MNAKIEGEDNEFVKIYVVDADNVTHELTIKKETGEIKYYEQDGYPERNKWSTKQELRIEQAAQYARYYVQRELGYPTLEPRLTPEWLAYALGAVLSLDFDEFEYYFGAYYQQYHSQLRDTVDPVIKVPHGTDIGGIVFRADIFLGLAFEEYLNDPAGMTPIDAVEGITDDYDLVTKLSNLVEKQLETGVDPIKEVSDVDVLYQTRSIGGTVENQTRGERIHSQEGMADAQLQMTPPQASLESDLSIEVMQGLVLHHLTCQVRDAYLRLGIEPPEPFRILGQGLYKQTIRYQHSDLYQPYHFTDANIDGYRAPGFETGVMSGNSPSGGSVRKAIERALFGNG